MTECLLVLACVERPEVVKLQVKFTGIPLNPQGLDFLLLV